MDAPVEVNLSMHLRQDDYAIHGVLCWMYVNNDASAMLVKNPGIEKEKKSS